MPRHPTQVVRCQRIRLQPRVVVSLYHPQCVFLHVLTRHKPRRMFTHTALPERLNRFEFRALGFNAANAQPLALPQRVKAQALVRTQHTPFCVFDRSGFFGDVAVQEVAERALANEANASGILLFGIRQADLISYATNLSFLQFTHGEQRFRQLSLVQTV